MENSISQTQDYLKFSDLLQRLTRNLHIGAYQYALSQKLSLSECQVLFLLQDGKPVNMKTIKEAMAITGTFATNIADRLVKHKLITRQRNPKDRRKVTITLTEEGKQYLIRLEASRKRFWESLFSGLKQEDKAIMEKGITMLITSLESMR